MPKPLHPGLAVDPGDPGRVVDRGSRGVRGPGPVPHRPQIDAFREVREHECRRVRGGAVAGEPVLGEGDVAKRVVVELLGAVEGEVDPEELADRADAELDRLDLKMRIGRNIGCQAPIRIQ